MWGQAGVVVELRGQHRMARTRVQVDNLGHPALESPAEIPQQQARGYLVGLGMVSHKGRYLALLLAHPVLTD